MGDRRVPFNRPTLEGRELSYIREAVEGGHTSMSGPFSRRVNDLLRAELHAEDVLLTTSCTDALELAALLLDLEPGDTVVVPSFTFVSTALAFAREGARILFCDIEPVTLGLDPACLAELLDDSVRAVVPVHYAGVACDLEGISKVLEEHPRVDVVEDNAHGLFGRYRDAPLGSFGRFSTLSFHETKNFICGEGGAIVLNRPGDVSRAHMLFNKGTNRREFKLGQVDKYSWQDTGSSFGMSDVLAGYLLAQLEQRETILRKRRAVFDRYHDALAPHAEALGFSVPVVPPDRNQAYHMFYLLLEDKKTRDHLLARLRDVGIHSTFHYVPLHNSVGGGRVAARSARCPVTDGISGRLIRLPFHNALEPAEVDRVAQSVLDILGT
jgi:dTDP-4-amino-4,6-dideoxygalactose transaminase